MTEAVKVQLRAAGLPVPGERSKSRPQPHARPPAAPVVTPAPSEAVAGLCGSEKATGYGIVSVPEFVGKRFVVVSASEALLRDLQAACAAHGCQQLATGHFLDRSHSHAEAKEKPGKGEK